ncbi:hypothetical protein VIBHAR_06225 [Vibrio campbellii ATCC BAA-1116]|uniref:Uncharacterized protein n=1 Tax=Vibrio campbellii (strain ATCC BAA-1116) TaxID=2902295 RepID=A7N205_VIBC1|nr:hypothetical protein VIBHAR_06225 [Vibrio campbellii ATCC BAA-1116]
MKPIAFYRSASHRCSKLHQTVFNPWFKQKYFLIFSRFTSLFCHF